MSKKDDAPEAPGRQFELSEPPDDPIGAIAWANAAAAKLLYAVMINVDGALTFREQLRHGADLIAKLGMTHSKALSEERILKLERSLNLAKGQGDDEGLEEEEAGTDAD